jgi:hypothetical protein
VIDHAAVMNSCSERLDKFGLAGVSSIERTIALAANANFEIEMGGVSTFFYNSAGEFAKETSEALVALGAMREAAALRRAMNVLKDKSWREALQAGDFEKADKAIRAEPRDIFSRICEFIDSHSGEFDQLGP